MTARKRKRATISNMDSSGPLDATDDLHKFEADNRLLENTRRDLEFEVEELLLENELLKTKVPDVATVELRKSLQTTNRQLLEKTIEYEHTQFLLNERKRDISFLEWETSEVQAPGVDDRALLEEQIESKQREIKQNAENLEVLKTEEKDAISSVRERETALSGTSVPLPEDWAAERSRLLEEKETVQEKLQSELDKQIELRESLERLERDMFEGTEINEREVLKALNAELELGTMSSSVERALEAELEFRKSLDRELREILECGDRIKRHRDAVVERHQKAFEMATFRERLESLQAKLKH